MLMSCSGRRRPAAGMPLSRTDVHAVLAQPTQPGGDVRIRCDDHPAFPSSEELAGMKGERGQIRARTDRPARVRSVKCGATVAGVRFWVLLSTSAKTGCAPTYRTTLAVAMNDSDGTITSSPGPTDVTTRARCSAVVQEETATAWPTPTAAANFSSNSATRGPCATQPELTAAAAAAASSGPRSEEHTSELQ